MRFAAAVAAAALVAGANAWGNQTAPAYTTQVVTAYTTYCPTPTEITHGGITYTVTEATTLTITDCPCTITRPVTSSVVTVCHTCSTPVPSSSSVHTPPYVNATSHVPSAPAGTGSATVSQPAGFTGAANKAFAASGAGLAAVLGFAAYIL